jgi:hypothetical protein
MKDNRYTYYIQDFSDIDDGITYKCSFYMSLPSKFLWRTIEGTGVFEVFRGLDADWTEIWQELSKPDNLVLDTDDNYTQCMAYHYNGVS